jgi:hypothetical protein
MKNLAILISVCLGVAALGSAAAAAERTVLVEHFTTTSS